MTEARKQWLEFGGQSRELIEDVAARIEEKYTLPGQPATMGDIKLASAQPIENARYPGFTGTVSGPATGGGTSNTINLGGVVIQFPNADISSLTQDEANAVVRRNIIPALIGAGLSAHDITRY